MTAVENNPGISQSRGAKVQDILKTDTRPVPKAFLDFASPYVGSEEVPKSRFTSPEFAALEKQYVWMKTWQFACLEDELKEPGSHVVYDVADESLIIIRGKDGEIRALHNACMHRGTRLADDAGRVDSFVCPFHGWEWDNKGDLVNVPGSWDFPQFIHGSKSTCLPQAKVATWDGLVFINFDQNARPFDEYAAKMIEHFKEFPLSKRYKAFHAVKEVECNWKVLMEAFSEGYHVLVTHPQIVPFCGDENSEYSIYPDNPEVTRFFNPFGVQSPHILETLSEETIAEEFVAFSSRSRGYSDQTRPEVPAGVEARAYVAETFRERMSAMFRANLDNYSDSEILDAVLYHLFPAFAPWAGIGQPLMYRWRPGRTPDTAFMDVIRMVVVPDNEPKPDPAPTTKLRRDQRWVEAPGMAGLADVFEQDMSNVPYVQQGLKSSGKKTVTYANYMEGKLRHFHKMLDIYIEEGLRADGKSLDVLDPHRVGAQLD
jgi:phenylpropionate dioxygenase-like ring-hydroxylating dioxygenase large terminal subunit